MGCLGELGFRGACGCAVVVVVCVCVCVGGGKLMAMVAIVARKAGLS